MNVCKHARLRLFLLSIFCGTLAACGDGPVVLGTQHPLVAQYRVPTQQAGTVSVQFGTDTTYGLQTASYPVTGEGTAVLVAGMKPSTTYHMRAQVSNGSSVVWSDDDREFTTGALPDNPPLPAITITRTSDPTLQATENPGVESIIFSPPTNATAIQALVTDRDGNPIWYYVPSDGSSPQYFKLMPNGRMLVCLLSAVNGAYDYVIREVDLSGQTIREVHAADLQQQLQNLGYNVNIQTFSHDFIPMQNGHIIVLATTTQDFTDLPGYPGVTTVTGDLLIDLDENWNPVWVWNAFNNLDVNRHPMFFPDWTHSNAVLYNPNDGNLLLSMRHQSWIIYIDYANGTGSGNILWRLGYQGDFTLNNSDPSQWFSAQHFPSFINLAGSQMTLAVLDNGDYRPNSTDTATCEDNPYPACYTRATVFQLDTSTMQAQLNWQYLPGFYSFWGGTIDQLTNGNVEFEMSEPFPLPTLASRAMEVTQTSSPQMVWQMDISNGSSYRTYRIPSLYPNVTWP